jgi:hypothetical protein
MYKSIFSNNSSRLVRSYWKKWGWFLSILVVVVLLFSMVRPEQENVKRGQLAIKLETDRERENLESKLGKQLPEQVPRTVETYR